MTLFPDITIAVIVLVIVVAIVLVARMGILPKKSLPYIAAGLASLRNRVREEYSEKNRSSRPPGG